jgi:thioesterase domain-containing protein
MAAHYINEIQSLQPQGPYLMGGYCLGGNVALEMAQQLHLQGQTVTLFILDSGFYNWPPPTTDPPQERFPYHHIRRFNYHWQRNRLTDALLRYAVDNLKKAGQKVSYVLSSPDNRRRQRIRDAHDKARTDYRAKFYAGRITLFRSDEFCARKDKDWHLNWSDLAAGGFDYHVVPGTHVTMVQEPHVQILAKKLKAYLEQAQTSDSGKKTLIRCQSNASFTTSSSTEHLPARE